MQESDLYFIGSSLSAFVSGYASCILMRNFSEFMKGQGMDQYPQWICEECGMRHGHKDPGDGTTWHFSDPEDPDDTCGWCGERRPLTEPRDFGYPRWKNLGGKAK